MGVESTPDVFSGREERVAVGAAMIETEGGYRATREALSHLERALASMSRRKAEYGPNFALFSEPVVDHTLRLRAEIDAYSGLFEYLSAFGRPPEG